MGIMKKTTYSVIVITAALLITSCGGSSGSSDGAPTNNQNNSEDSSPNNSQDNNEQSNNRAAESFVTFESGQVRPLALSPDGQTLLATNTPAGTLELFSVDDSGVASTASIPVGLEPVAVAFRDDSEAWVVNHLSDSISVVDLTQNPPRVINTLLVGDEPRDIVFAGADNRYAYITAAHRGQNGDDDEPLDAELYTPGVGRADVWVFDSDNLGTTLGGAPTDIVTLFGDTARSLEASIDGSKVYVAVMHSGNKTTAIGEIQLEKSGPTQSADGSQAPDTGLIVQQQGTQWVDEAGATADLNGTVFGDLVPFSLPDLDVFVISATANPQVLDSYSGVGTTLFNMVVNPANDQLLISNTEALNVNRFEGQGIASSSVRGDFLRNRITVIADDNVTTQNLNTHIDRTAARADDNMRANSISQPMGMAIDESANRLYVAGFGSNKLFVYDTDAIGDDVFSSTANQPVSLSGGGPADVILNSDASKAYVLTRFNNSVAVIDTNALQEEQALVMFNPEPAPVVEGRPFLYAAENASRFGDVSCASCHVFGDTDGLGWDLGNPDGAVVSNPNEFVNVFLDNPNAQFHPMKGPMTTQSFRGMANAGPMHWRGDRTGIRTGGQESLELAAFKEFNEAFVELLGNDSALSETQMTAFAEFALAITYPPNPIRALDNSLNDSEEAGQEIFFNEQTTGDVFTCNACHTVNASDNHFGTSGKSSVEGDDISQEFKVPHFRNLYQKVGKFGNSGRFSSSTGSFGDQIKGFGFMHDGNMDTLQNFFKGEVFLFSEDDAVNDEKIQQVVEFVMASDSNLAPIVGQQVTLNSSTGTDSMQRLDLLVERAQVTEREECDLVAKGVLENEQRGYFMDTGTLFQSDRADETITLEQLVEFAEQDSAGFTFTCLPPGSGTWFGIDRDEDGVLNGDS